MFDPFGDSVATTGSTAPTLGFQADVTDPASDHVWMGSRWYDGGWAAFLSRDTVFGELRTPISLNRYTYGWANPLLYFDPDGRYPTIDGQCGTVGACSSITESDPITGTHKTTVLSEGCNAAGYCDNSSLGSSPTTSSDSVDESSAVVAERSGMGDTPSSMLSLGGGRLVLKPPDWHLRTVAQKLDFIRLVDPAAAVSSGSRWGDLTASFKSATSDSWYAHGGEIGDAFCEKRRLDVFNMAFNPAYAALTSSEGAYQTCRSGVSWECAGASAGAVAAVDGLALSGVGGASALGIRGIVPKATTIGNRLDIDAPRLRLGTNADEAVFWSGIRGGDSTAASWAVKNRGASLETTLAQRGITLPPWDPAGPATLTHWRNASAEFAQGARGNVRVLQADAVRVNSVWAEVEFPMLKANPNVISITAVNPSTGVEVLLWGR